jgi:nucleolin
VSFNTFHPRSFSSSIESESDYNAKNRFGFLEFANAELASAATRIANEIDGRTPEFRLANAPTERPARAPRGDFTPRSPSDGPRNLPNNTVWVGNVAWAVGEEEIQDAFEAYGPVARVSLPRDRETGKSRGIAYVEFSNQADAESAVHAVTSGAGIELEGRSLRLDFAEKPSDSNSRGGNGGQRSFGSGGGRGGRLFRFIFVRSLTDTLILVSRRSRRFRR